MTALLCRPLIFIAWLFGQRQQWHIERTAQFRAWQAAKSEEEKQHG